MSAVLCLVKFCCGKAGLYIISRMIKHAVYMGIAGTEDFRQTEVKVWLEIFWPTE